VLQLSQGIRRSTFKLLIKNPPRFYSRRVISPCLELNQNRSFIIPLRFSPPLASSWSGLYLHHCFRFRCGVHQSLHTPDRFLYLLARYCHGFLQRVHRIHTDSIGGFPTYCSLVSLRHFFRLLVGKHARTLHRPSCYRGSAEK
jgi:hypothetical protein